MKKKLLVIFIFALFTLAFPLIVFLGGEVSAPESTPPSQSGYVGGVFRVRDFASGDIVEIDEHEFVVGALMCEMPVSFGDEALKAQAIACHSYALHLKNQNQNNEYDFVLNLSAGEGYINETAARKKYGSEYEAVRLRMLEMTDAVYGLVVSYDGAAACTPYHAISAGYTESALNSWGYDYPYLVAVDSLSDINENGYESTVVMRPSELSDLITLSTEGFSVSGEPEEWFGAIDTTPSGYVSSAEICDVQFTGTQLREALSLRSSAFSVQYAENEFIFSVKGYGHGVGMSQRGADALAKSGSSYADILLHYYPSTQLVKLIAEPAS